MSIQSLAQIGAFAGFAALYGSFNYNWTITNDGEVSGTGVSGLQLGTALSNVSTASITNQSGGVISGDAYGIQIFNTGVTASYILNYSMGSISATNAVTGAAVYILDAGTVANLRLHQCVDGSVRIMASAWRAAAR